MQERQPVVYAVPQGYLVGDVAHHHGLLLLAAFDTFAQYLVHRHAGGVHSFADMEHQFVEDTVLKDVIHLSAKRAGQDVESHAGHPLPVAVMPKEERHGTPVALGLVDEVETFVRHALLDLLPAHRHQLDGLHDIVGQKVIVAALGVDNFLFALLGKGCREVLACHLHPVLQGFVEDEVYEVGEEIVDAKWQERAQVGDGENEPVKDSLPPVERIVCRRVCCHLVALLSRAALHACRLIARQLFILVAKVQIFVHNS